MIAATPADSDGQELAGQVALVTGAASGLGRAYAARLARMGATLVLNNRDGAGRAGIESLAAEIRAQGGHVLTNFESVSSPGAGSRMVGAVLDAFGRLDIVIPNAGLSEPRIFHREQLDHMRQVFEVNFWGALEVVHAALPGLRTQRSGRILLTASSSALFGDAGFTSYGASKSALIGLMLGLAHECEQVGVRVNTLVPFASTKMTHELFTGEGFASSSAPQMSPDAVAVAATWLVSPRCDRNGEIWVIGGRTIRRAGVVVGPAGVCPPDVEIPAFLDAEIASLAELRHGSSYPDGESLLTDMLRG